MITVYVLKVPEFAAMITTAQDMPHVQVTDHGEDYYKIQSSEELVFNRKAMRMKPAVWYGLFTGGLDGRISHFGRDDVRVVATNTPT